MSAGPDARAGHHADVVWLREDNGFASEPSDDTHKGFGGDATLETFEGSHNAVRVWNNDRTAEEIVKQLFEGSWSVTGTFGLYHPWWLASVFGTADTSGTGPVEHTYALDQGGEPQSMQLVVPIDGITDNEELQGCVPQTLEINNDVPGNAQFTLSGVYAALDSNTDEITMPSTEGTTFKWSDTTLGVGGSTAAKVQNASVTMELNTDLVAELGASNPVDYSPKVFAPQVNYEKIVAASPTVDVRDRFENGSSVSVNFNYDNGESGSDQVAIETALTGSLPDTIETSGVNNPEDDLVRSLSEMALDASVVLKNDTATPP